MKVISRGGSKLISTLKAIGAELIKLIEGQCMTLEMRSKNLD